MQNTKSLAKSLQKYSSSDTDSEMQQNKKRNKRLSRKQLAAVNSIISNTDDQLNILTSKSITNINNNSSSSDLEQSKNFSKNKNNFTSLNELSLSFKNKIFMDYNNSNSNYNKKKFTKFVDTSDRNCKVFQSVENKQIITGKRKRSHHHHHTMNSNIPNNTKEWDDLWTRYQSMNLQANALMECSSCESQTGDEDFNNESAVEGDDEQSDYCADHSDNMQDQQSSEKSYTSGKRRFRSNSNNTKSSLKNNKIIPKSTLSPWSSPPSGRSMANHKRMRR